MKKILIIIPLFLTFFSSLQAQHSVARRWNEEVLHAISLDLARPIVHARNLFHTSVAMYDAWAVYTPNADTYLLGKTVHGFNCPFHRVPPPDDVMAARDEAISFAAYRLILHRFEKSLGFATTVKSINKLMDSLGYNRDNRSINYKCGAAEMGNYIAHCVIQYGLQDGSNEANAYASNYYETVNLPLRIESPGNPSISDLSRWQPIQFAQFIDQSGNSSANNTPEFLGPEWGNVAPFALQPEDITIHQRDGNDYLVYHDPGPPAQFDSTNTTGLMDLFTWNHSMVVAWSSLLDPSDSVKVDISPVAIGNISQYPASLEESRDFYNFFEGGDTGTGYTENPATGQPYQHQWVYRGDYARVLAEFWADGPSSTTPPGHWFEILNYVNDQPGLVRRIRGTGPLCDKLEWDVKAYFTLGGAMHDAAVAAWGIKGWYDSSRPVSAIRAMAERGQCTDPSQQGYHPGGLPLIPGLFEVIEAGDALSGIDNQYIGEVKIKTWKGPKFINNPLNSDAGVGWIRAKEWWPYQRPTFVTPPFAGYVSGHSTYSRAAAEVLTAFTGTPFFPGGMGVFECPRNEFLVFEDGPSQDVTLQWATYRDASDQCSLSRIYGGIHPPMDDIPGRLIGIKIGTAAVEFAEQYFTKSTLSDSTYTYRVFPNPTTCVVQIEMPYEGDMALDIYSVDGRKVRSTNLIFTGNQALLDISELGKGMYWLSGRDAEGVQYLASKVEKL